MNYTKYPKIPHNCPIGQKFCDIWKKKLSLGVCSPWYNALFFFAEAAENTTPQETENVEEGETPLPPKQNLTQIR